MGKLFNLKEWLTVADAARHLTIVFGEDVTEADVLRLALDGRLKLSAYFVNGTMANPCEIVRYSDADLKSAYTSGNLPEDLRWVPLPWKIHMAHLFPDWPHDEQSENVMSLLTPRIDNERYLTVIDEITYLDGVWDFPMIGAERNEIEGRYQEMVGGPYVNPQDINDVLLEGVFLEKGGAFYQLNERRTDFPELEKDRDDDCKGYYPVVYLPDDAVLVVRTEALRKLEASIQDISASAEEPMTTASGNHISNKLATLNQAAKRFWANADREDRGTHPKNADVAAWLKQCGYSPTLAEKAVSIIRPEWAPTGRKPEE